MDACTQELQNAEAIRLTMQMKAHPCYIESHVRERADDVEEERESWSWHDGETNKYFSGKVINKFRISNSTGIVRDACIACKQRF